MFKPLVTTSNTSSLQQSLREMLQPQILITSGTAGIVTGTIGVIRAISYASLIFSGALAIHLPVGLGLTVFSTAVTLVIVALTSTLPGMIATPLTAPTVILAMIAAGISTELQGEPAAEVRATVVIMIAISALLTGALLLCLGLCRQGNRIRVIPYPVIGGFMAGTGWLLTRGFVQITTDIPLTWSSLEQLFEPKILWCWVPGLVFAIALLMATHLWQQFWVMPLTLAICAGLFYLMLLGSGTSLETARAAGWFLGPFPQADHLWQPITLQLFSQVHWSAILHQSSGLLTVMVISFLSLLLSNSSIELVTGQDLDLNSELKSIGLANLATGLGGGMMGNQALPSTLLVNDIGAKHRLTSLFAVLPSLAVLALGSSFLSYLPKAVLGSVILYLGLSLLWKWLYKAYFSLPLWDYMTVWAALVVINTVGFLQGIVTGFVSTVIWFMYCYSQVDVARQVFSGATTRSNVDRSPVENQILTQNGSQIYVLELQGFLFFGTANYLLNKVRDRLLDKNPDQSLPLLTNTAQPLEHVVIDFRQVQGIDSSAVLTFDKILKLARQHHFSLVLTNLLPNLEQVFHQGLDISFESNHYQIFADIDRGLEWCEQQILSAALSLETPTAQALTTMTELLAHQFLSLEQAQRFMTYLNVQSFPAGHYIFRQSDGAPGLYFIESGQVSVLLEQTNGHSKRLQTCTRGHLLGEMRFFSKVPLSTSVITDTPCQLYSLPKDTFEQMQTESSDLAQLLQAHIVKILCDSLSRREQQLQVMQ